MLNLTKICTFLLVTIAIPIGIYAQNEVELNPKVENARIEVRDHNLATISFEFIMQNGGYDFTSVDKSLEMSACLMNSTILAIEDVSVNDPYFNWRYDSKTNCIYGVQKNILPQDKKHRVAVRAQIPSILENGNDEVGFLVNIQPDQTMNLTNDRSDDAIFLSQRTRELRAEYIEIAKDKIKPVDQFGFDAIVKPNPAYDKLNITVSSKLNEADVLLVDLSGKIVIKESFPTLEETNFNLQEIPTGRYELLIYADGMSDVMQKSVIISK